MKQQTKFYREHQEDIVRKREKKLARHFSKLSAKELGIMYEILDKYDRLNRFGEKQSSFFSNLEYMLPLLSETGRTRKGI
jgi:hypothetical protein